MKENTTVGGFSAGPHRQDHPAALNGILDSSGLAAIFAGLEPAGLHYLQRFAGKSPGDASRKFGRPRSVNRRGIGPDIGGIDPQNMPLIPPSRASRR